MSTASRQHLLPIQEEFRRTLRDCQELYQQAGAEYSAASADQGKAFAERMLDLHRGLVVKVFVEVAHAQRHWSSEELALAADLFEHVWGKRLNHTQVRAALAHILTESHLSWDQLVGPFERLSRIRPQAAALLTVVMRLANLVAKADGTVTAEEVRQVRWIQAELRRALLRVPVEGDSESIPRVSAPMQQRKSFELRGDMQSDQAQALEVEAKTAEELLQESLGHLEQLIGLASIKEEVRGLVNFLKLQQERERFGLPTTKVSLHAVFSGNPGTGKTTVARLLGRIYGAMGILKTGHLIETDRSGLVAEYAGQTAPKTNKLIDQALDGVLFIDEAYSLVAAEGDDPYGAEAVQILLKRMEDHRDRLIVVLAGYPDEMDRLLKSNPGLSSRFAQQFLFPDYLAVELCQIFENMCQLNHYELPALTRVKLLLGFQFLLDHRDEHFGNGRLVRNVFERAIGRLANRVAGFAPLTREMLTTLEPGDITFKDVPASLWTDLASVERRFRVICPGCKQPSGLPQKLLGRTVQCRRCQHMFAASWGELIKGEEA